MKKFLIFLLLIFLPMSLGGCELWVKKATEPEIKQAARRASVQVAHYVPVMKVSFTTPLPKDEPFDKSTIQEMLAERIKKLEKNIEAKIKSEIESSQENRYESSLTSIEAYGHLPKSQTEIPIGAISGVPKWAKFPEKVLTVYKTEKTDISPWDKAAEKDVLAISETAGVSISKAKEMLSKIKASGYSVSKTAVDEKTEVQLLWYDDGWDDSYPTTLRWEVTLLGEKANLITGYDSRGILKVRPIEKDGYDISRVHICAGYIDLKDKFKPKSSDVRSLENEIKSLKRQKEALRERADELQEEKNKEIREKYKRDITSVTWRDVLLGTVKLEISYWTSKASGIYLGNVQNTPDVNVWPDGQKWYGSYHKESKHLSYILTNAHVAAIGMFQEIYISKDKEVMVISGPGYPFIRYTQESDTVGSPAFSLRVDGNYVYSEDYDCAVLATTAVPNHEQHRALLGNSDNVKSGTRIIMVGNPGGFQKFTTEGVVSNVSYSFIKSVPDKWKGEFVSRHSSVMNPSMWIDAPISIGGTSGSGIWALEGPEAGKVVSLHNVGVSRGVWVSEIKEESFATEGGVISIGGVEDFPATGLIKHITPEIKEKIFSGYSYRDAIFNQSIENVEENHPDIFKMLKSQYYVMVQMAGMHAGVPINNVKAYLQERGIDPQAFEFEGLKEEYWTK